MAVVPAELGVTARGTSPMPPNIQELRDSLPYGAKLTLANNYRPPLMNRIGNGIRRIGNKLLLTGLGLTGLYGAYKLGQYKDVVMNRLNKFGTSFVNMFKRPSANYTRSGT